MFLVFYFLSGVTQAGNSFWLSKWTSEAYREMPTNHTINNSSSVYNSSNMTNSSMTTTTSSNKFLDVGVYSALGVLQCIYIYIYKFFLF